MKSKFLSIAQGRRVQKIVSTNNGSIYVASYTNRFLYDGWNLVAVVNPASTLLQSFVWGLDLSGSLQGAGGVGGLLVMNDAAKGAHFCAHDGNGNVAMLLKASDGTAGANYEFGPFGEALRATGPMAKANHFRFSTKYQDDETDLVYYGYGYYSPSTGRWVSRDPLSDLAFYNNYTAAISDPERLSYVHSQSLNNPYLALLNDAVGHSDPDGAVPALLIFGVGRVISSGILACYNCSHCYKCLKTAKDYGERAANGMEPDRYFAWVAAAKPGSECMSICADCGLNVLEVVVWVGGRYLVLKYYAGGHY